MEGFKEFKDEMSKTWSDFQAVLAKQNEEVSKIGVALPETKATIEKMNERMDKIETILNRPGIFPNVTDGNKEQDPNAPKRKAAFSGYLRKGAVTPEESKLLTESDDTTGGYLAPPEFVNEILKGIILISPMRGLARIRTTGARSVRVPKRTGTFAAQWVAEVGTRSETTGLTYGMEEIPVHEMYAFADIANQDLEDSQFNLDGELNMEFTEQFAKAEGAAFTSGTAAGQPEGFMTNAAIAYDPTTDAALLTYKGFVSVSHNLKSGYAQNGTFLLNRKTIGLARQIVDGQSRPIWMPFAQSGMDSNNPPTILGSPYIEFPDMPDVAGNAYPVAFGDFKRGYYIVDRIAIQVQRDPYTQNTKGVTRFIARKRVGGQVVMAEAIRKLKVAVT